MKYYKVTCYRGHSGSGKYSDITFVFEANNLLEAQKRAKQMPSVKHGRPIMCGCEISKEEYDERISISAYRRAAFY